MGAGLRGREDKASGFDGARAEQNVPMRLAGDFGESGGHGEKIGTRLAEAAIEMREAQIVANRQT